MPPRSSGTFTVARRAATVVLFGAIAVYAAEGLAIGYANVQQRLRQSGNYDRRTRLEVLADLRAQGSDPLIHPTSHMLLRDRGDGARESVLTRDGHELLPLGGIARRPAVVCNESGAYLVVRPDQYGFNNPSEVWNAAPIRIAGVGDSFTFGYCVEPADSFMGVIRMVYPATVNLGITSNGPLFEFASLQEYLPALKPQLVLWFFFENDIEDIQFERADEVLMRYLRDDGFTQHLRERQPDIDRLLTDFLVERERRARAREADANRPTVKLQEFLHLSRTNALLNETRLNLFGEPDARVLHEDDWRLFDEILGRAKATVESWGGRMHFVYLPTIRRFGTPIGIRLDFRTMLPKDYVDALHTRVLEIARRRELPITDLTDAFVSRADARQALFTPVFHYSLEGNRLVAEAVLAAIRPQMDGVAAPPRDPGAP